MVIEQVVPLGVSELWGKPAHGERVAKAFWPIVATPCQGMAKNAFVTVLESDLRALGAEARKSDGLAGQLAGWLSNSENTTVKEAGERAVMRLRAFARGPNCLEEIRNSKV